MLKIADIRKIEPDSPHETPTVKAVVLNVGQIQNEHGKERLYVVLGDETGSITATIYNPDVFDRFRKNMGVILMDILLKQSYIGITKRTEVAVTQAFIIPDEVLEAAPKLPCEADTITAILNSPEKSLHSVNGIVSKVCYRSKMYVVGLI